MGLSNRQRVFIERYLMCWNASQAAREAGYRGEANRIGSRLLTKDDIKIAIEARVAELKMSTDEVLTRLAEQGRGDIGDFVHVEDRGAPDGVPEARHVVIDFERARAAGKTHLVKSIAETRDGIKIELYDAQAALALLGRAHQLFVDRTDITSAGKPVPVKMIIIKQPPGVEDA
jgi:phage terminase small subunit